MLVKFSIKVVAGEAEGFVLSSTEVTIDGNKHLIDEIVNKIKEIPGVEIE